VAALAGSEPGSVAEPVIAGWSIDDPRDVGSVMGAIHGVDRSGFIGEVYQRFPFPPRREDFWQRAAGEGSRAVIEPMLQRWARPVEIPVVVAEDATEVAIGPLRFSGLWFCELVAYVWRGGYPRWLDARRPACVEEMRAAIERSSRPLFDGQPWDLTQRPC